MTGRPPRLGPDAYALRRNGLTWKEVAAKLSTSASSARACARLHARRLGLRWPVGSGPGRRVVARRNREAVRRAIGDMPACTTTDVARVTGLHRRTVRRHASALIEQGIVSWDYLPDKPGAQRLWLEIP